MTWADIVDFSSRFKTRRIARCVLIAFLVCLAVATHIPNPGDVVVGPFRPSDKLQHCVSYAMLTALMLWVLRTSRSTIWRKLRERKMGSLALLLVVLAIGSVDELTQPWFGRSCSIFDLLADGIGASLVLAVSLSIGFAWQHGLGSRVRSYEPLKML